MSRARAGEALTTPQLEARLAERYKAPEFALLFNVKNRTGYSGQERFADAVSMNLFPSRGLEVQGFELKASRSDWIKERDEPRKAEAIARFCDRWWLVVGSAEIVKPGELPPTWGLLVAKGKGLAVATEAPKLDAQPLDRKFVAALFRRAVEQSPEAVTEAETRGYGRGYKNAEEHAASRVKSLEETAQRRADELLQLRQQVQRFEQAAGFSIAGWRADARIGEVVRLALAGRFDADLVSLRDQLARLLAGADDSIGALAAARAGTR